MDGQRSLSQLFDKMLVTSNIFKDREKLRPSYSPKILPHREKEIEELAGILVAALKGETPSNIFVYGKTGTGKKMRGNHPPGPPGILGRQAD